MARVVEIPVQPREDVAHFSTSVVLDRRRYKFEFIKNSVDQGWVMSINEAVYGIGLVLGIDLLYPYRYLGVDVIPPGILGLKDKALQGRDPDLTAFIEGRVALLYWGVT